MEILEVKPIIDRIRGNMEKVIVGKSEIIDYVLTALLSGGHVLLEDVPGTGKTMMAKSLSKSVETQFKRIQFTPDLLPSDLIGINYYNQKEGEFVFRQGALFTNILLADEINRATPRTQSSLLESMEEKQITVDGTTWGMPWGLIIYIILILFFTFFYANITINPQQLAENFQKNGSYIPGIRPGNETERYVRKVLNRVTVIGALALIFIAALPVVLTLSGIFGQETSLALGGTGLIITVGVALELNNQIDGLLAGKSFDEVVAGGGRG